MILPDWIFIFSLSTHNFKKARFCVEFLLVLIPFLLCECPWDGLLRFGSIIANHKTSQYPTLFLVFLAVTWQLYRFPCYWLLHIVEKHYHRAFWETCDPWDMLSELWGDMTWPSIRRAHPLRCGRAGHHFHRGPSHQEEEATPSNKIYGNPNFQHCAWLRRHHPQDQLRTDQPPRPPRVNGTRTSGGNQRPQDVDGHAQPNPGRPCPVARGKPDISVLLTTNSDDF